MKGSLVTGALVRGAVLRRQTLRVWGISVLALIAAGAGMSSLAAGSAVTSVPRMAFAAGVLSTYASFVALIFTDPNERSRGRCVLWGGIPLLVGAGTVALVANAAGPGAGVVSALPWLAGPALAFLLGPALPQLRRPRWLQFRSTMPSDGA